MLRRAQHPPHGTPGMEKAIKIFQDWVNYYSELKESRHAFTLLPKPIVQHWLPVAETVNENPTQDMDIEPIDTRFAKLYTTLEPKKRLADTLLDPTKPYEADWEIERYNALSELVEWNKGMYSWTDLWDKKGVPSTEHLRKIMWAWSVDAKELKDMLKT